MFSLVTTKISFSNKVLKLNGIGQFMIIQRLLVCIAKGDFLMLVQFMIIQRLLVYKAKGDFLMLVQFLKTAKRII